MQRKPRSVVWAGLCSLVVGTLLMGGLAAKAADVDFSGKTIEFWVPYKEGGGSDVWARSVAPLLSKHLPGNPDVVVVNNHQGGGIGGTNEFHRRMEPTGEMIFNASGSNLIAYLLKDSRVQYEYLDFIPFLASPTGAIIYVPSSLGIKDPIADYDKMKEASLRFASMGVSSADFVSLLAFEMLDLNVDTVFGMSGAKDRFLAVMREETSIDYQTTPGFISNIQPLVEEGKMVPLFTLGAFQEDGSVGRDPTFPDLPSFVEVYEGVKGEKPSGPAWKVWRAFFGAGIARQKFAVLPKGTPDEIVEAYWAATEALAADPESLKALQSKAGAYDQVVGQASQKALDESLSIDDETRAWMTTWLEERFDFRTN